MKISYSLPKYLNKSNVLAYLKEIQAQIKNANSEVNIDCSNVLNIDSAGIALLLELTTPNKFNHPIKLVNLSSSICELCALYQIKL